MCEWRVCARWCFLDCHMSCCVDRPSKMQTQAACYDPRDIITLLLCIVNSKIQKKGKITDRGRGVGTSCLQCLHQATHICWRATKDVFLFMGGHIFTGQLFKDRSIAAPYSAACPPSQNSIHIDHVHMSGVHSIRCKVLRYRGHNHAWFPTSHNAC